MELTHKDYKRINNLHNEGLPGFATGVIGGLATQKQQGYPNATDNTGRYPSYGGYDSTADLVTAHAVR